MFRWPPALCWQTSPVDWPSPFPEKKSLIEAARVLVHGSCLSQWVFHSEDLFLSEKFNFHHMVIATVRLNLQFTWLLLNLMVNSTPNKQFFDMFITPFFCQQSLLWDTNWMSNFHLKLLIENNMKQTKYWLEIEPMIATHKCDLLNWVIICMRICLWKRCSAVGQQQNIATIVCAARVNMWLKGAVYQYCKV